MIISVVIQTYNPICVLLKCLKGLERQTVSWSGYEVVIVDDSSTDGTAKQIAVLTDMSGLNLPLLLQFRNLGKCAVRYSSTNIQTIEHIHPIIIALSKSINASLDISSLSPYGRGHAQS